MNSLLVGVPKERGDGEKRVALVPESIGKLKMDVLVEAGAGLSAGFADSAYESVGAKVRTGAEVFAEADLLLKVQPPTPEEARLFKDGSMLVSYLYAMNNIPAVKVLAGKGITAFALELMPRISRAQPMDTLSSQANLAGYKAAVMAADSVTKIFPLMMTAAGTIAPSRVFVLGAGVSGLQAIATARRLGAVVEAYDVRPTVKEQVESLGAKFVELPIQAADAQTSGGYAKAQSDEFYKKQQELLAEHARASDVVITTALVPGKPAPLLVTEEAVKGMRPGSVIIDLAAEQGGNCALTEPGKTVTRFGVMIHGPLNVPSTMAPQASQLFSRNLAAYVSAITKDGRVDLDSDDQLVKAPMVLLRGNPVVDQVKAALEGPKA